MISLKQPSVWLALFLFFLSSIFYCFAAEKAQTSEPPFYKNIIVFDAGSSGSRIVSYLFENQFGRDPFKLVRQSSMLEVDQSLKLLKGVRQGDLALNVTDIAELIDEAVDRKNDRVGNKTPQIDFFVGATAGLRDKSEMLQLSDREVMEADLILELLALEMGNRGFYVGFMNNNVRLLSGLEEGAFTWLGVNTVNSRLESSLNQYGIVELGGGSVQIAWRVNNPPEKKALDSGNIYSFARSSAENIEVYGESYLGFGLNQAFQTLLSRAEVQGVALEKICRDFDRCSRKIRELFALPGAPDAGVKQVGNPDLPEEFYVNGYAYDRTVALGLPEKLTTDLLKEAAKYTCERPGLLQKENSENDLFSDFRKTRSLQAAAPVFTTDRGVARTVDPQRLCIDLTYISVLLEKLGLNSSHTLWVKKYVRLGDKYHGFSWPLGYAIGRANNWLKPHNTDTALLKRLD